MEEIGKDTRWYEHLAYKEAKRLFEEKLTNIKQSFVAAGYYLKYIRDNRLYLEDGYKTIWEFAEDNYGITRTTASRWMAINDKFSLNGNTPILAEEYKQFGKSQLQEMLYLDDKQLEQVSPEMTKNEIRELRATKKEEFLSALGFPRKTYPDGSLISTPGCDRYTCFSCHHEGCEIRGEDCYCVEASMGNPFPCTTLNVVENLKEDIGTNCQFVNKDLAHHRAGDGEPVPCCKNCKDPCGYECRRSVEKRDRQKKTEEEPEQLAAVAEEHDNVWFVKEYAKRNPSELKRIMKVLQKHQTNTERAHAVQKELAPYGYHAAGNREFDFIMRGFAEGIRFKAEKQEIRMTYSRFVKELLNIYNPSSEEFVDKKCAPAHMGKEPKVLGNTSTLLDEKNSCPPDQSSCPRQEWGPSPQQQHEGAKECAKCWNEWKKMQKILQNEEKPEEKIQEPQSLNTEEYKESVIDESKTEVAAVRDNVIDVEYTEVAEEKHEELSVKTDEDILKELLDHDKQLLEDMKECFSDKDIRVRKQSIKVAALAGMLSDMENLEEKIEQPELPKLKNMDEREEFVLNYRTWPVWTKNEFTEETHYRYELPDNSAIVVREYPYTNWRNEVMYGKTLFLIKKDTKYFKNGESNMTALKEHLKEVQKGNIC